MGKVKEYITELENVAIEYGESFSTPEYQLFVDTVIKQSSHRPLDNDEIDFIFCGVYDAKWKEEGEELLERRKSSGFSQTDVVKQHGISVKTLDRLENGKSIQDRNRVISPLMMFYAIKRLDAKYSIIRRS